MLVACLSLAASLNSATSLAATKARCDVFMCLRRRFSETTNAVGSARLGQGGGSELPLTGRIHAEQQVSRDNQDPSFSDNQRHIHR